MIFEAIMGLLMSIVEGIIGLLPIAGALSLGDFSSVVGTAQLMNGFLPVAEAVAAIGLIIGVRLILVLYGIAKEVWSWIPFV